MQINLTRFCLLVLLLATTMGAWSCKKDDPSLADCIVASDWRATSFTEDGVELIGFLSEINSLKMEYKEYNKKDQRGNFFWEIKYNDGTAEDESGTYRIYDSTSEMDITFTGEVPVTFNVSCLNKRLILNGNVDGVKYIIEASR